MRSQVKKSSWGLSLYKGDHSNWKFSAPSYKGMILLKERILLSWRVNYFISKLLSMQKVIPQPEKQASLVKLSPLFKWLLRSATMYLKTCFLCYMQYSQLQISKTLIPQSTLLYKKKIKCGYISYLILHFNSCYLKLLVPQS